MDGREAMALSGSPSFYMHRGITGSVSGAQTGIFHHTPPGFRPTSNPSGPVQSNVRVSSVGSTFSVDPSPPNFSHGINSIGASSAVQPAEQPVKKKRGRPRKYGPDGPVSLGLSPMSTTPATGSITPAQKRNRGRPPGSGRRQQLAALGKFSFYIPWSCVSLHFSCWVDLIFLTMCLSAFCFKDLLALDLTHS